jgi:hypothetical protein
VGGEREHHVHIVEVVVGDGVVVGTETDVEAIG